MKKVVCVKCGAWFGFKNKSGAETFVCPVCGHTNAVGSTYIDGDTIPMDERVETRFKAYIENLKSVHDSSYYVDETGCRYYRVSEDWENLPTPPSVLII